MKLYSIEVNTTSRPRAYRFSSLYNGTRGNFHFSEENAIKDGEDHQKILCALYPELNDLVNVESTKKRLGEKISERKKIEIKGTDDFFKGKTVHWTTKTGDNIDIDKMDINHLRNALKCAVNIIDNMQNEFDSDIDMWDYIGNNV